MEAKLMHVTPSKCTACKNCELACAFSHSQDGKPTSARVTAIMDPDGRDGCNQLVICMQCDSAACVAACPSNALWRNMETGAIYHKPERCIQCSSCVAACPFGNMKWDTLTTYPVKCDLCDGDPVCVKFCPTKAIDYR
jgi:anaerobic carbon-monoxide dehydrogenase iron sulfur subunit